MKKTLSCSAPVVIFMALVFLLFPASAFAEDQAQNENGADPTNPPNIYEWTDPSNQNGSYNTWTSSGTSGTGWATGTTQPGQGTMTAWGSSSPVSSITINGKDGITDYSNAGRFIAYQVFAGTVTGETPDEKISDVKWGNAISADDYEDALKAIQDLEYDGARPFEDAKTPADVVKAYSDYTSDTSGSFASSPLGLLFADTVMPYLKTPSGTSTQDADGEGPWKINNIPLGYYLINDTGNDTPAVSDHILRLLGTTPLEVTLKVDVPTVKKEVNKMDHTASIGEVLKFTLRATLPENYGDYATYKLVLTDTPTHMAIDQSSVEAYVDFKSPDYKITTNPPAVSLSDEGVLTVTFDDLKKCATERINPITKDNKIVIYYNATLTADAVTGQTGRGNHNDVLMEYSNDPNSSSTYTTDTPSSTSVYTFGLDIKKLNGSGNDNAPLAGAQFTLQGSTYPAEGFAKVENGKVVKWCSSADEAGYVTSDDTGHIDLDGLPAGTYTLTETKAPDGFVPASPITFTLASSYDAGSDLATMTLTSDYYNAEGGAVTIKNSPEMPEGGIYEVTINNYYSAVDLPETGGIGTAIFYTIGALFIAGAVVIFLRYRRSQL